MGEFVKSHAKSILAAAVAAGYAAQAAISDGVVTSSEKVGIFVAICTALGVYAAPNKPSPPPA